MNTLGPSRKGTGRHAREGVSRKMVLNLDLNSPPVECQLPEGTSGCRHPRISRGTSISVDPQSGNPTGRQQGSSAPSNDCLNGGLIDVELIEDDVVILSSPRGLPLRRNHSRRDHPVTVVLDEDPETNLRRSGIILSYVERMDVMRYFMTDNNGPLHCTGMKRTGSDDGTDLYL